MAQKSKWFDANPKPLTIYPLPAEKITQDMLDLLFAEAKAKQLNANHLAMLEQRAKLDPQKRLLVNLNVLLGILHNNAVDNVIPNGLTSSELGVLSDIHSRGYSYESRLAAQGLLNIAERGTLLQVVRQTLLDVRKRNDAVKTQDDQSAGM